MGSKSRISKDSEAATGIEQLVVEVQSTKTSDASLANVNPKALKRKMDLHLIPWLCFVFFLSFLDRSSIGNAKVRIINISLNHLSSESHSYMGWKKIYTLQIANISQPWQYFSFVSFLSYPCNVAKSLFAIAYWAFEVLSLPNPDLLRLLLTFGRNRSPAIFFWRDFVRLSGFRYALYSGESAWYGLFT